MICPNCNKEEMNRYVTCDMKSGSELNMLKCHRCGHFILTDGNKIIDSDRFTLEFSTTAGDKGRFYGTQDEIWKQADNYKWIGYKDYPKEVQLRNMANGVEFLKYGFMNEFLKTNYKPFESTYDNCFWIKISYGIS